MKKLMFLLISGLVFLLITTGCLKETKKTEAKKAKRELNNVNTQANKPKIIKKKGGQEKTIGDKDADGKKFGYIKAVYLFNKKTLYLEIDYANMLTGEEAQKVATQEGQKQLDADYYISNVNPKVRTFEIGEGAKFIMQTWQMSSEGKIGNKEINFNDFMNIFNSGDENSKRMAASPYWIILKDNKVVKITEQYLP